MKAVGFAVVVALILAFIFIFTPLMMPDQPVSGATSVPPNLENGTALNGQAIQIGDSNYRVERLKCPDIGTKEGDAAQKALASILATGEAKCLPINDTTVRCEVGGKDIASVMLENGHCVKE